MASAARVCGAGPGTELFGGLRNFGGSETPAREPPPPSAPAVLGARGGSSEWQGTPSPRTPRLQLGTSCRKSRKWNLREFEGFKWLAKLPEKETGDSLSSA